MCTEKIPVTRGIFHDITTRKLCITSICTYGLFRFLKRYTVIKDKAASATSVHSTDTTTTVVLLPPLLSRDVSKILSLPGLRCSVVVMVISLDFFLGSVSGKDVVSISFDVVSLNGFAVLVTGFVVESIFVVDAFVVAVVDFGLAVTGFVAGNGFTVVITSFVVVFFAGFVIVARFVFADFVVVSVVVVGGSAGFTAVGFVVAGFLVVGFVVAGFVVVANVFVSKDG